MDITSGFAALLFFSIALTTHSLDTYTFLLATVYIDTDTDVDTDPQTQTSIGKLNSELRTPRPDTDTGTYRDPALPHEMSEKHSKSPDLEAKVLPTQDAITHQLEEMGYKQELKRSLGMMAVLGLAFSIMAVPVSRAAKARGRGGRGQDECES